MNGVSSHLQLSTGSSCCAVQLTINALAPLGINLLAPLGLQGCAGFNTFLGPLRPYTRGATATFFAVRWASAGHGQPKRALVVATVLAALLTYMPEMLLFAGATALAPPTDGAYYLDVAVGTLRSARPAGPPAPSHALARDRRQYGVRGVPAPRAPRLARLVG